MNFLICYIGESIQNAYLFVCLHDRENVNILLLQTWSYNYITMIPFTVTKNFPMGYIGESIQNIGLLFAYTTEKSSSYITMIPLNHSAT